ncbi:type II toxin-antitoxin system RelE/ParE family toxin [Granulicella sp. 5B5]|uniref:type II toxin-antitoxin system RelE/ParE family toxin n=1 Tax=Granulicella sp. 5B5 TaxID=1617967 RepID=UPI0015F71E20|nr:type II toxin-antitoxin system RelE/ParE family toxin [Granulicella sp. 5B5]QMV17562.1 type II toxin-antitoxin system RelE/ParE family toxin [Granulicella sp. 5B5]
MADLREIGTFTLEKWGIQQAEMYLDEIDDTCVFIAKNLRVGRVYDPSHPTWRRFEHKSHVILYSQNRSGVTIQLILHKSRLLPSTPR